MATVLHGRDADLEVLDETLAAARAGRGRALFVTGEAGIGKSTLLAEARARAGALVLSGAAWESGGAPSYWPWIQVLRDAADHLGDRARALPGADLIASFVPGWAARDATQADGSSVGRPSAALVTGRPSGAALDATASRFALLDAVVRALIALANDRPIVILLDDLHAADLASLDLLLLLVREVPRASIALIAAWRDGELATRTDAAQRLARATRFGTLQPLRRLTAEEVARWVGVNGPQIFATTEGNPLFVEETLRARQGSAPQAVSSVIAEHLALPGEATREILAVASVLGRDIDPELLLWMMPASEDAIFAGLREAEAVGIVERRDAMWRFRHVLLRDQLYDALPPSQRSMLHRRVGELLETNDPVVAAHHLLAAASPEDASHAVATARRAAQKAAAVYAFEDAVTLLERAVTALDRDKAAPTVVAIDLRLELGTALHHCGRATAAHTTCVEAAALARMANDVGRLAQAAMVYARELTSGTRDPVMIGLLQEASERLPADDSRTRACVLARLAAALVPGPDTEVQRAQGLARECVAMARRLGNDETLMFALRYAAHAHSYQVSLEFGYSLATEMIALSDKLGRPLDAIDHRAWLVGANLARRDLAGAHTALERFEALLAPLHSPHYRWRAPILRAVWATRAGDFVEAERHIEIVRTLSSEYGLERASWAVMFARLGVVACLRDPVRAEALVDEIRGTARMGAFAGNFISFVLALAGREDEARAELERMLLIPALVVVQFGGEAIIMLRATEHATRAIPLLEAQAKLHPIVHGPQGSLIIRPSALTLGELYTLVGRFEDAIVQLERGLEHSRTIDAPPFIASGCAALARALEARGAAADHERIATLTAEANRLARSFELHGIASAPSMTPTLTLTLTPPAELVAAPVASRALSITCSSQRATVRWHGREVVMPSAKGFEYLAALVAAPHREIHVSDLVGDEDRGDAGEVLDAKARSSYRQRAQELTEELDDARTRNDLGRIERLTAELEAVTDELLAGTGLGGRARKAGSRVDRARVNVQRRIKDALRRLAAEEEALGRYLEATIRTGTFCSFVPLDS